jgi:hypothetical protein
VRRQLKRTDTSLETPARRHRDVAALRCAHLVIERGAAK